LSIIVSIIVAPQYQRLAYSVQHVAFAQSPSFVRQEIVDAANDWIFWKPSSDPSRIPTHDGRSIQVPNANNISGCKSANRFVSPDIQSVSYISNGKTLNATVWLADPFIEPAANDSIDPYQEQLVIKISNLTGSLFNLNLDKYAAFRIANLLNPSNNVTVENETNSTIAGNPSPTIVYAGKTAEGLDEKNMTIWTINKNKLFDITYSALNSNFSDYMPIIEKMLRLLEFTPSHITGNVEKDVLISDNTLRFEGSGMKIDYPVNWKREETIYRNTNGSTDPSINKTIILRSPFHDEQSEIPSWHETTFTMALAIDSIQHEGVTDYRVVYSREPTSAHNNNSWTWSKKVLEVSAYDKTRLLEQQKSYSSFYDKDQPYILFSFDLEKVNFPQQYRAVFFVTDYFVLKHHSCRLLDTTNWIPIPPPEFLMTSSPNSLVLRPGEEKDIELIIKGNTHLPSTALLTEYNKVNDQDIHMSFVPNRMSIPASSSGTSTIHVKVLDNAKAISNSLPISANISFPTSITNRGGESFSNSKSVSVNQTSNITLTVLPHYTTQELFNNFVSAWITPISGVWTFLAGIGAVVAPLIIRMYRKNQKNKNDNKRAD
jgi:hypothetical protein